MSSITPLLGWRDYLHVRRDRVRGDADYYLARASEIRDIIIDVLGAGLSEGAEQALGDLAEEDMVDFNILVDLSNEVDIPGVEALEHEDAAKLRQFLAEDPWRSLCADTEINVCLAMLRSYGESEDETIWHMGDPHMLRSISTAFDAANNEQMGRFVAEINNLARRPNIRFDNELTAIIIAGAESAAARLGVHPPDLFN